MRFRRTFGLLWLVMMSGTSFAAPVFLPPGEVEVPRVSEIRLERTACEGMCPTDELILRENGTAQYVGKSDVENVGTFTGVFQAGNFQNLAALAQAQKFWEMEDRYFENTDSPSVVTTIARRGEPIGGGKGVKNGAKRVVNNGGAAPASLWGIEMAIRGVASDIKWKRIEMKGASGIWGQATMSPIRPVQRLGEVNSRPKRDAVLIVQKDGKEVARTTTDKDGDFEISLVPGDYVLVEEAKDGPKIGGLKPRQFAVKENEWAQIVADFDTGIR